MIGYMRINKETASNPILKVSTYDKNGNVNLEERLNYYPYKKDLSLIKDRIQSGYYNQPEVILYTSEAILKEISLK